MRFGQIRLALGGKIRGKVLSETLRAMERDGFITRTAFQENPPRVEYELTDLGRSLLPMIESFRAWADEHPGQLS